jgi:hypothetical protein
MVAERGRPIKDFRRILSYMLIDLHMKYPLLLPDFNQTGIYRQIFEKKIQMSYFIKMLPRESELFMRADRHYEACIRFSQTCELNLKRGVHNSENICNYSEIQQQEESCDRLSRSANCRVNRQYCEIKSVILLVISVIDNKY